ncbi:probable cytochrome P450 6a14 [Pogonomyrmex barbatus]|uniref:Probable cytochrome P450 6a14 n=1 Tax=Pogonomyrmex barbatus TaxID=144034 RepID=A0A6I9W8I7_9HYME|nr:probable cytochrome P450 6a14 [Pogonomyrmex barbatus]
MTTKNEPNGWKYTLGKTPVLIIKDPDLIKDVLIKNFSTFASRGIPTFEKTDPLPLHLFLLEPKRWRPLRIKLSPVFTSAKLKEMFFLISECADHLIQYTEKVASKNGLIECRELMAKYTTDVIGSCAFGIEMNSMSDKDSEFRKMGRQFFESTWSNVIRERMREIVPGLYHLLGYILPQSESTKFFTRVIMESMEYRDMNTITRHDFIDTLRELKKNSDQLDDIELTDNLIASQAFVFFLAGFETSSTTMSNALYELALNPKIQDKLRAEIDESYVKYGEHLTYDNIKQLDYLDKVFKETLRKYPPLSTLMRQATSNYTFENTKISIPKGMMVSIPAYAIHRDPNIYPEPDVFDPERFDDEAVKSRHSMVYLPFGAGPRNCIGARFAIYQSKIGLIKMLRNYKVETCEKTVKRYINDPKTFILSPIGGIHLKIVKIDRT